MVTMQGDKDMEKKSNFIGQSQAGVNGLTNGDLRKAPASESPRALTGASEPTEMSSPPLRLLDGLPARRIELRYWVALLVLGLAIWAAILFWLV
jgi:hypothetical protein